MKEKNKSIKCGLITSPLGKAGTTPLTNLVTILVNISDKLFLITGDEGYKLFSQDKKISVYDISQKDNNFLLNATISNWIYYFRNNLKTAFLIINLRKNVDLWFFFIGTESQFLPIWMAKILGKRIILFLPGSAYYPIEQSKSFSKYFLRLTIIFNRINSDNIIVYSNHMISACNLHKYKKKIIIAHEHYINFDEFSIDVPYEKRKLIIGYIGRFADEKGTMNFFYSVPIILEANPDIKFLVIGDGPLKDQIDQYICSKKLQNHITIVDWVDHERIPYWLNMMKLLVIPSETEGLPNVMIEAMACGTPVLATPVGAIPDIIEDQMNGFILSNNAPITLSENILNIINCGDEINTIINNAKNFVNCEFKLQNNIKKFLGIIKRTV